jgi:transaldolase
MTKLEALYDDQGQSPWLDNLTRASLLDGTLSHYVQSGVRGVTANPSTFAKSIGGSDHYDEQIASLLSAGRTVNDAYWDLVIDDLIEALKLLRPTFDGSAGSDGFVSVEVSPRAARDVDETLAAARNLHIRVGQPNMLIKIPATAEGVTATRILTGEGVSLNITLIFSLERYNEIIDAYLDGLELYLKSGGDLSTVHSVASFFVSRVDSEIDRRLETIGTPAALALLGRGAVAQAKLAYQLFRDRFAGDRWDTLHASGAHLQRPLWASTSVKNPAYSPTLYVDNLIGPDTVNTLTEQAIATFEGAGSVARTIDSGVEEASAVLDHLREVGVNIADVASDLEKQGIEAFDKSFAEVLDRLTDKK